MRQRQRLVLVLLHLQYRQCDVQQHFVVGSQLVCKHQVLARAHAFRSRALVIVGVDHFIIGREHALQRFDGTRDANVPQLIIAGERARVKVCNFIRFLVNNCHKVNCRLSLHCRARFAADNKIANFDVTLVRRAIHSTRLHRATVLLTCDLIIIYRLFLDTQGELLVPMEAVPKFDIDATRNNAQHARHSWLAARLAFQPMVVNMQNKTCGAGRNITLQVTKPPPPLPPFPFPANFTLPHC